MTGNGGLCVRSIWGTHHGRCRGAAPGGWGVKVPLHSSRRANSCMLARPGRAVPACPRPSRPRLRCLSADEIGAPVCVFGVVGVPEGAPSPGQWPRRNALPWRGKKNVLVLGGGPWWARSLRPGLGGIPGSGRDSPGGDSRKETFLEAPVDAAARGGSCSVVWVWTRDYGITWPAPPPPGRERGGRQAGKGPRLERGAGSGQPGGRRSPPRLLGRGGNTHARSDPLARRSTHGGGRPVRHFPKGVASGSPTTGPGSDGTLGAAWCCSARGPFGACLPTAVAGES